MAFSVAFGVLFLFIFVPTETMSQQCRRPGDLGGTHCVLLTPYYSEYQWATCLTDDYIMRSASARGKTHYCRDRFAVQCWYQCMVEFYDLGAGPVNASCRCSPSTTSSPTTLPPHCFSPQGDDCDWYRECLEVRYPCQGNSDGNGYAIEFAEKFCKLYSTNYKDFSSQGQSWIDAVRKCLQVELVPSLRPWVSRTCRELRDIAFNSHAGCYLSPANGAPSMCNLSCGDIWKSFWLVAGGGSVQSAPLETFKQVLDVAVGCFSSRNLTDITCLSTTLQTVIFIAVSLPVAKFLIQVNRLTLNLAGSLIGNIAMQLGWNEKGIGWFPFLDGDNSNTDSDLQGNRKRRDATDTLQPQLDILHINILLVDLYGLNISNYTTPIGGHNLSLDQAINELASAVSDGSLSQLSVFLNDTELILDVYSVGQCADVLCNSTNRTILSTAPPTTSGVTRIGTRCLLHQVGMICLVMIGVMFMYH